MKFKIAFPTVIIFSLIFYSCNSDLDDCCGGGDNINSPVIDVPFTPEEINPTNDPLALGIGNCDWNTAVSGKSIDYPLNLNLPAVYDLGFLMPAPRSQGAQGSCVSWATHYYLATYMDNIRNDSIISSIQEIMSPSFAFNQIKASDGSNNCFGSTIAQNLDLLINTGALPLSEFSYNDTTCAPQPDMIQLANTRNNLISSYENIGPYTFLEPTTQESLIASSLNEVKSALFDNRPVIVSMLTDEAFGRHRNEDVFTVSEINEATVRGCHAMTIVGYNDDLNAFRVLNSWGDSWANDGYVYVSYDFFMASDNPKYQKGVLQLTVAFND
ncbi:putative cysteine protease [Flavobacteria bacterium BBFL7]|nr:putative cysteine protease [Flavobacteria bacterium BBFL7]